MLETKTITKKNIRTLKKIMRGRFSVQNIFKENIPTKNFTYGWCYTDHKDGVAIRKNFRKEDYMLDEPYASKTKEILEKLGLPHPKNEEVFRGTHHDLLFLNSHGVVIRIGPTNIEELINPGIIQPLGWIDDKENNFSVAIYPGIEHVKYKSVFLGDEGKELQDMMRLGNNENVDMATHNVGIIRIEDDDGIEKEVKILLDPDNEFNGSTNRKFLSNLTSKLREEEKASRNRADALNTTISTIFNTASIMPLYRRAFQMHQPLRNKFWAAFKQDKEGGISVNEEKRNIFWNSCAEVTNKPKPVIMHSWSTYINENGIKVWRKEEIKIPNLSLYTSWTGKKKHRTSHKYPKLTTKRSKLPS